jgi:hypothetical protein
VIIHNLIILANFGYILDMKVDLKNRELFYSIGYLLELIIKIRQLEKKKSSKSGEFWSFLFSMGKKILCIS